MAPVSTPPDELNPDQVKPWAFVIVFLASPILMSLLVIIGLSTMKEDPLGPLSLALQIGHVLSLAALVLVYFWLRKR